MPPASDTSYPTSETSYSEADSLITYLQGAAENDKAALARELHDELGGLMVSAVMDLGSVSMLQPNIAPAALQRLDRARKTLEAAIDLKRRVIENLRPSILDNFGLFAALRWHVKRLAGHSGVKYSERYPELEPHLKPEASLALFRVAEESLAMASNRGSVKSALLQVRVQDKSLSLSVADDGETLMDQEQPSASTALASMRHRLRVLGGEVRTQRTEEGGTILTASLPLPADYGVAG